MSWEPVVAHFDVRSESEATAVCSGYVAGMIFSTTRRIMTDLASARTRVAVALAVVASTLMVTACSDTVESAPVWTSQKDPIAYGRLGGEAAQWQIHRGEKVSSGSRTFTIDVSRSGCASGKTGDVLDPVVQLEAKQVVIVARVAKLRRGGYNCQSNDWVPATVTLSEPLGRRQLIDGECTIGASGTYAGCQTPVRWDPVKGTIPSDF